MDRKDALNFLTHSACFSADSAVEDARHNPSLPFGLTGAEETRIAIRAALHALEANGWIQFTPPDAGVYEYRISPPE